MTAAPGLSARSPVAGKLYSAAAPLASAVYEGTVRHRRHAPHPHEFAYRMAQLYIDLDEVDRIFAGRWFWSIDRRNLAELRRSDFLGPSSVSLADAVRARVSQAVGLRPRGPIRLLTHLRYAGYSFNPVSFYYCFGADGTTLDCIVAEVTNTPWRERHAYVLPVETARRNNGDFLWSFDKTFHVSPFMAMARGYVWRLSLPGDRLRVHMDVMHEGLREFDATLALKRQPLDARSLRHVLFRYPLMTSQVVAAIYWQAIRLWLKRNPVHVHQATLRDPP